MVVIDVGCSKGEALKGAKDCLANHGVEVYAIGIDVLQKVAKDAKTNLDEFELGNVLDVTKYESVADVTLCLNAMRTLSEARKSLMIKRCVDFLKPDGMMITHVGKRYQKQLNLHSSLPARVCKSGRFGRLVELVCGIHVDTKFLTNDDALAYAKMLQN